MTDPNSPPVDASHENGHGDDDFELACSSCNADLAGEKLFQTHRVCPHCRRHFWMPARERIQLLLDPDSFQETNAELVSIDPLLFHDRLPVADRIAEAREQPSIAEAVVTGTGTIGAQPAVVIALDLAVFGTGIGIVAGEKIALAMEHAVTRRLPVIAVCSGGSGKGQEGVLFLAQIGKLASGAARLRRVGVPLIALLTHPTTGNVLVGIANQADITFAEPGAQVGMFGSRDFRVEGVPTGETLIDRGGVDGILDRTNQRGLLENLLRLLAHRGTAQGSPASPPASGGLRAAEELSLAHRAQRPAAADYISRLATGFVPLRGDRATADSPCVLGGIGRIQGLTSILLGSSCDESGLTAASFAKVNRLLRLAAHLELPVVSFVAVDNRATFEDPGLSLAMAQTLTLLAAIPVPIVAAAIGEVAGLTGMTLLTADRVVMQEHAVISMGVGEPVASARNCLQLGLVDAIVTEPEPAADADPEAAALALGAAIGSALAEIAGLGQRRLVDERTRRLRHLGLSTAEGREVAKIEWRELQDLQRMIGRSFDDLRQRWEHRQLTLPGRTGLPQLPNRSTLPAIVLPKFKFRRPDLAELANRMQATRRGLSLKDHRESEQYGKAIDDRE